jgi:RNase P/RNase MRP subunit p29
MITPENILSHEIIGLYATVERCSDIYLTNLSGRIIMETKNIIGIETSKGIRHISKTAAKKNQTGFEAWLQLLYIRLFVDWQARGSDL